MGEEIGAVVWLDRAPLKYAGLSYTEIWISEAQERMVLAVPPANWPRSRHCANPKVLKPLPSANSARRAVCSCSIRISKSPILSMEFLHGGRPKVVRDATYSASGGPTIDGEIRYMHVDHSETLLKILGSLNVCSREWVIRQYDHEVLGGSVVKPLVGTENDGPSDAAVLRPVLSSRRGMVIGCGMNPRFGDFDTVRHGGERH